MDKVFAPNYSRPTDDAIAAVREAESRLVAVLAAEYPQGAPVRVVHHRGVFYGTVVSVERLGTRVVVRNEGSGKISRWWHRHVECL